MKITYIHPLSNKEVTDEVIAITGQHYTVNRNEHHRVLPLKVHKSDIISITK